MRAVSGDEILDAVMLDLILISRPSSTGSSSGEESGATAAARLSGFVEVGWKYLRGDLSVLQDSNHT